MTRTLNEPELHRTLASIDTPFARLARGLAGDLSITADGVEAKLRRAGCTILSREVDYDPSVHPFHRSVFLTVDIGIVEDGEPVEIDYDVTTAGVTVLPRGEHMDVVRIVDIHRSLYRILPRRVRRSEAEVMVAKAEEDVAAMEEAVAYIEANLEIDVEDDDTEETLAAKAVAMQMSEIDDMLDQRAAETVCADIRRDLLRTALASAGRSETVVVIGRSAS